MPSKRMVPEQEVSEMSDEMARLAAAKDAEIARLRNTIGWEASVAYRAEIAALTEQRDALAAHVRPHRPSLETLRTMHSHMTAESLQPNATPAEQRAGHRPYYQHNDERCYLCALVAIAEEATEQRDRYREIIEDKRRINRALTEQRDRAIADRNETRDRTYETIRQLREQRDRAMKALREPSEALIEAMCAARYQVPIEQSLQKTSNYWAGASNTVRQNERLGMRAALKACVAALDADTAEPAPSLPETP